MAGNIYDDALEGLGDGQQPAPAENIYDETLRLQTASTETSMRRSLRTAAETTPDRAAEARKLSLKFGLPPSVVERNLDAFKSRDTLEGRPYQAIADQTPHLASWILHPDNAKVAHDDLENLGLLEWIVTAPQRAFAQQVNQLRYSELRFKELNGATLTQDERDRLASYQLHSTMGGALGAGESWFRAAVKGAGELVGQMAGSAKFAAAGALEVGAAGAAAGSLLPGVGTVAGAIAGAGYGAGAGFLYGGFKTTWQQETTQAYDEMLTFKDEHGQPIDPAVARVAALAVGGLNGLIEVGEIATFAKSVPGLRNLTGSVGRSAMRQALRVPTIRGAFAELALNYGKTLTAEVAQEVAQRAIAISGEELGKLAGGRGTVPGQLTPGNIDLFAQPAITNPDGTISTVDSLSVNIDGREVLLPTVTPEGQHFTGSTEEKTAQALAEYQRTGRHLGIFATPEAATAFAKQLHEDYAAGRYAGTSRFRSPSQVATELGQELTGAVQSFALGLVPGPLLGLAQRAHQARLASQNVAFFKELGASAQASKTIERLPQAAQEFIAQATKDGPIEHVYAPVESWASYWQSQQIDPEKMATELTGDSEAYQTAIRSGEDLTIPTAAYAVKLAGTEHNAFFAHELRLQPDQMNAREAAAFATEQDKRAAEQPEGAGPPTSTEQVRAEVTAQFEAAGIPADTAAQYAALYEATFGALAERAGVDPLALYASYGLQVQRPDIDGLAQPAGEMAQSLAPAPDQAALPATAATEPINEDELARLTDQAPPASAATTKPAAAALDPNAPIDLTNPVAAVQRMRAENPAIDRQAKELAERARSTRKPAPPRSALGQELFQPLQPPSPERRGSIAFTPDKQATIKLFEKADLSTVLHESGHLFLEVLRDVASEPEASPQFKADLETLNAWFFPDGQVGEIGVTQHEQFARGFEAYLMEGKAPSVELRGVFSRFRAWLVGIYRTFTGLHVLLTDDVRGVFGRMLATDAAIAEAEAAGQVEPMFLTAQMAGMTDAQFALYRSTVEAASRTARETLERKLMADVQREHTATWKAQRETVRAEVAANVHQRREYRALAAMQRGTNADGSALVEGTEPEPLKLSRAILVERYGEARLKALPKPYIYTREGGLDPNAVAELFGFSSGDALLQAVSEVPPMKQAIEQETTRRMLAEHGSLLLDGSLHEQARAAVANEDREAVIRAELRALAALRRTVDPFVRQEREAGRLSAAVLRAALPPASLVRATAAARIAAMPVRGVTPALFWSAARRASQQAFELLRQQDFDGAIVAKQQELINTALYREAAQVREDIAARVRQAQQLAKGPARARLGLAGPTYLEQVDGVLDRYSFARIPAKAIEKRASLRKWVEALEAQGLPVDLPDELLDDTRRIHYTELTVEAFVGVTDGLQQIAHLARLKNKLLKAVDQREFDTVRNGLVTSIRDKNDARKVPLEFRPRDERVRKVAAWFASHSKIALLARALDGHVDGGPMWEAIIRPLNAAADDEVTRKTEAGRAYRAILEAHYPGRELATLSDTLFIPAINNSLSKEGRLAVALNWGNQTSRDRVLADPTLRFSLEQAHAVLDTLDERDWKFVQATWDYVNTFWPEIAAKQERVTGLAPEKVEALPVSTRFGEFAGGYYPLAYDGRKAPRAEQLTAASDAKLAVSAAYVSSTTRRGHTKARLDNVKLPIRLDLGVVTQHIDQVLHDLTHHETLIDAGRLLRDPAVVSALNETKGDLVYQQFTSALQDIALGSTSGEGRPTALGNAATFLRTRTQIAGMAWNLWTALQQPLGVFNGMSRVGPVWVARGMKRWLRDAASMESTSAWIAEVSPMMRERVTTATQDLQDVRASLQQAGGWFDTMVRTVSADKLTQQTILDGYLWHIGLAQRVADIPTWLGGYEKAMAAGNDEARAIALADQAVLDSQGGGQIKDLAQVQRSGPIARLFMTFYSYGNTVFNATADVAGATNFKSPASVATFLGHMSLLLVMPAVATEALRCATGRGKCQDWPNYLENVAGQILGDTLNMMVVLREAGSATKLALGLDPGTRGYAGPAGLRLFELYDNFAQQVHQGKLDEGLAKASNALAGVLFRYPSAQVQRTIDGWVALEEGRTSNPLALLMGGPPKTGTRNR